LVGCAPATWPWSATPTLTKGGGGILRVALREEPASLNPDLKVDDACFTIAQSLFNKLVTLDADYRIIPDLARAWEISSDGLTYTFHLAEKITWHDGKPFSAADVKWTLEAILQNKGVAAQSLAALASVDTPDEHTVVLHLREPQASLLANLAWYGTFILPRHIYENTDWATNPANAQPIGTGPFRFKTWVKGKRIELKANTAYFREGPLLDEVVYLLFADAETATDALIRGEVDFTGLTPSFKRLSELAETTGVLVRTFPHPARYYIAFNLRRPPLDDVRVREAINAALNRAEIVNQALGGYGAPGIGFYTPALVWAYNGRVQVPAYDLAAASKVLDEVGLSPQADGIRLRLGLVHIGFDPWPDLARVVKEQLAQVGIEIVPEAVDPQTWSARVMVDHDFDLALVDGSHGPDPDNMRLRFGSQGPMQVMGYHNPELDALLERGMSTADTHERAKAYHAAQEILARDLPIAPLAEFVKVAIFREGVTGLPDTEARGLVTFQDFSLVRVKK